MEEGRKCSGSRCSPWLTAVGALGLVVSVQGVRFERRVEREARALFAGRPGSPADATPLEALPAPVLR
jgi:hypothetical protein